MLSQSIVIALSLCFAGPLGQAGPHGDEGVRREGRQSRRGRPSEEQRQEWRQRRERMRNASPEERSQMRIERRLRMTTRTYDLDESQQAMVRSELQAMQAERRTLMGADADEYDRLQRQMYDFWSRRSEVDGGADGDRRGGWRQMRQDPEFVKLREQMGKINEKYPRDWQASVKRLERLLPEEQAKKGRENWQRQRQRWQERSGENRRGRRDRRRGREPNDAREATGRRPAGSPLEGAQKAAEQQRKSEEAAQKQLAEKTAAELREQALALHPWEEHLQKFIEFHGLTTAQANAGKAILKDVLRRAIQIQKTNASEAAAAERMTDPAAKKALLAELKKPVDELFGEFKSRLDSLLTRSQRGATEI